MMDARRIVLAPEQPSANGGFTVSMVRRFFRALCAVAPDTAARLAEKLWFRPPRPGISPASREFLATGEEMSLIVNGGRVAAWSWGAGPTVILMHGWGGYGAQMQSFVEPLVRAGFRAVAFDAPSHGASQPGAHGARQSTFFEFRDVMLELSRRDESVAGVIAHSGGCTAVGTAIRAGWSIPAAVFVAPMASPLRYQRVFQQALGLTDDVLRRFRDRVEKRLSMRWEDLEMPLIPKIIDTPPVLVIHDREDRETSWRESASIADSWPEARLMTTTGLGHRRLLRDPAVVDAAVRHLHGRSRHWIPKSGVEPIEERERNEGGWQAAVQR